LLSSQGMNEPIATDGHPFVAFPEQFRHCPKCGHEPIARDGDHLTCSHCHFDFHINPASAVGSIILDPAGQALFIRRACDPGKGKLGVVGGFINAGESGEDGLIREIQEEIGLHVNELEFLASFPNRYHYRGTVYDVLDLYFIVRVPSFDDATAREEVEEIIICRPEALDPSEMAFPSMQKAVAIFHAKKLERK
jgi:ADP-ribose pyrophosphatase YjhB (NUDIX family)